MRLSSLKRETKKFIAAVLVVALCICLIMTKAIIGGAIDEYHMPFSTWPVELYISEFFMILIYTSVFTLLLSVPLWYFFIGEKDPAA